MKLEIRHLRKGEADFELLWGGVLSLSGAVLFFWLKMHFPVPPCLFRAVTEIPCLACGGRHCISALAHGDWLSALRWNPLVFAGIIAISLFLVYVLIVVVFRLPRIRLTAIGRRTAFIIRMSVITILAATWIYLIATQYGRVD